MFLRVGQLSLKDLRAFAGAPSEIRLAPEIRARMAHTRKIVEGRFSASRATLCRRISLSTRPNKVEGT
jgi:hypothetical protein